VVFDRYLRDPQFRGEYDAELEAALDTYFAEAVILSRIDEYYSLILESVMSDTRKWGSNEEYPERVEDLRYYVRMRRQFIAEELGIL
jgi:spore coat protein CotH